jgi:Xaa-Pro aminopeptidase
MLAQEPSIKRGLTSWDRALMPRDEFDERLRLVRAAMRKADLQALIVSGNMYEDAALIHLVGGNVDGTMVLPLDGEPCIFTVSGSRESFFLRELTWMTDVSHQGALVGGAVRKALERYGISGGRIGTAGLQVMTARQYADLTGELAKFELVDFSSALFEIRRDLRPRERVAVERARAIVSKAVAAAEKMFAEGGSNAAAVIEAERVARLERAWDFRALANLAGEGLQPLELPSEERHEPLLLWAAARYQGYWADRVAPAASPADGEAALAVAAMVATAKAGATAGSVADAALSRLSEASRRSALSYGLGRGIGIELNGWPDIVPGSQERLREGTLLSFHVFATGGNRPSFASAMVEVRAEAARPL